MKIGELMSKNETEGTINGFDIVQKASVTRNALRARIDFMKRAFENETIE